MAKWKWATLALAVMILLAGCSSNNSNSESSAPSGEAPTASASASPAASPSEEAKPVTIVYEAWTPYKEDMDKIVAEYKKIHPEITVEVRLHANYSEYLTAIKTSFASGDAPDLFAFDSPTSLANLKDQIEPIDEWASKAWGDAWKDKFIASTLTDVSLDGKTMGIPMHISPGGLIWYNKTALDKYGIGEPKTYEELKKASDTLRKNGMQPLLLGAKDSWIVIDTFQTILNDVAPGKQYDAYAKKIPFTDPDIVKAFDLWKKMFDDKIFQDDAFSMTEYMDVYNAFIDKQSGAFESNGAWNLDIYANADLKAKVEAVEWGVMPFPDLNGDGKVPPTLSTVGGYALGKDSENKEAAFDFLKFMTTEKGLQIMMDHFLATPPTKEGVELTVTLSPNAKQNRDTIGQIVAQTEPVHRGIDNAKVADKMYEVLTKVAYGQLSGADAAAAVQKVIDSEG
ncbi:ABC transporter substrate-binding protein [Cohnella silvisoli]|uniref:Extracellular solute-binding protein n=1 Tax=Cohnella silvisoli TaxID=2873699 RepID=A0ABV1KM19_9BACL|nr:extracellular solute-binding protein [Cohnella silvisoli]MCD9020534.1 extracellular solute-binding protein [Cohnella silvisoli]